MKDIEKAIETQQKLIKKWELRAQHLKETIDKFPWGRDGQQYDFGDWRESELKRRKQQIEIASITISTLQRQLNNGWIPVSERLPEERGFYIFQLYDGRVHEYYYANETLYGDCDGQFDEPIEEVAFSLNDVLAWQPLPEPWKEVEHEKNS